MNSENLTGAMLGGRYEMLEKIGTGGMATVYKAKDTLLNRFVAIKILRDALEDEEDVVKNFIHEAQSSASLVHNNIVSVYDVGEENGLNYMVMEYVDGITLKDYIKEKGALPWQEACDFAIQIGQGIQEAHARNIIHRDIKPQNILMTKDKTLKVTDFGIARAVAGETNAVGGTALGSVHYISPEQARGGYTDARSDIYSLGIVLYEMLTGKVPFDGDNAVSIALMHLEKEPVNVKIVNMDISTDLAYVTMKAIAKSQADRYQSVQEMLDDLHCILADEPLASQENNSKAAAEDVDDVPDDEPAAEESQKEHVINDMSGTTGRSTRKKVIKKKTENQRKADRTATVLAISTVLVIGLLALGIFLFMNARQEAEVPNLVNMTLEQAAVEAQSRGLKIADEVEYSLSDVIAENCVISHEPQSGEIVRKDSEIKLVISIGSSGGNISVLDVKGKTAEEALTMILEQGLAYAVFEEYSDTVEAGRVIRQTPIAGTKLNRDDIVTLHVSKGKPEGAATEAPQTDQVPVPSLIGLSREQAEQTLADNGLYLGTPTRKASSSPEGSVISQSPDFGNMAQRGSYVSIVLSAGPEPEPDYNPPQQQEPENNEPDTENDETEPENNEPEENNSSEENNEPESESSSTKTFTVRIPDSADDMVQVEIYKDGVLVHSGMHSKDEGSVSAEISGSGSSNVEAYIDGAKVSDRTVEF